MIDFGHYFQPDHVQSTIVALVTFSGAVGAGAALIAKAWTGRKDATEEIDKKNDCIRDETIVLLKQQNELLRAQNDEFKGSVNYLTTSVSNLNAKVENLTIWFEAIACLRAPVCSNRDCPDRNTFASILDGLMKPSDLKKDE